MKKSTILTLLILSLFGSLPVFADDSTPQASSNTAPSKQFQLTRGQSITLEDLSSIAKTSTARDEQGNSVTLKDKTYTVESYTKATVSIMPPDGKTEDLITLDLNQ